jgi:hypothetical protein
MKIVKILLVAILMFGIYTGTKAQGLPPPPPHPPLPRIHIRLPGGPPPPPRARVVVHRRHYYHRRHTRVVVRARL